MGAWLCVCCVRQIWLTPSTSGIVPSYEEAVFSAESKKGTLRLVASPDGALGSVTVHADARILAGTFDTDDSVRDVVMILRVV